jgi:sialic acid synthase SpsE
MLIREVDLRRRVLVVAEIGNNHEGDPALALRLVRLAAEAGADAVKFQTFVTERYVRGADAARFARLKSFELPAAAWNELRDCAHACGIAFISTPFDLESAERLEPLVDAFKIASGDNTFVPLLERVAASRHPVIMSTGLATMDEVAEAIDTIAARRHPDHAARHPVVLHCVSAYPVAPEDANLGAITTLRVATGCIVGYSDHTLGIEAAALAVGAGARVVEKHFTIAHDHSDFRDHQLSATPEELAALVERIRRHEVLMGDGRPAPRACELENAPLMRRFAVARHDLAVGARIGPDDVDWLRCGGGVSAARGRDLLGSVIIEPVGRGDPIVHELIERPAGAAW